MELIRDGLMWRTAAKFAYHRGEVTRDQHYNMMPAAEIADRIMFIMTLNATGGALPIHMIEAWTEHNHVDLWPVLEARGITKADHVRTL